MFPAYLTGSMPSSLKAGDDSLNRDGCGCAAQTEFHKAAITAMLARPARGEVIKSPAVLWSFLAMVSRNFLNHKFVPLGIENIKSLDGALHERKRLLLRYD